MSNAPTTTEIRNLFNKTISGRYTRTDGAGFDWKYEGFEFAPRVWIVVDREDVREEGFRGTIEFDIRDPEDGVSVGPSVTVYGPELDWHGIDRDNPMRVKPAYCNASTCSTPETLVTRAMAHMLKLAADYADAWTEELRPALEEQ